MFICNLKLQQKTPIIYLTQSGMVWEESLAGEKFALHVDICNVGRGFVETDYISFFQILGHKANTRDQTG